MGVVSQPGNCSLSLGQGRAHSMSDDEYADEEVTSQTSKKGDEAFAKAKAGLKKSELDEQLREYINEWRKQRGKEEEELKKLKDKQAKRKEIRAEQEKKLASQKKEEEEKIRKEESKTKEQLEEEKKIALSIRIKPIDFNALDSDSLKAKGQELWNILVQLETDKYDYEQRRVNQDYELRELKERQKVQLRQKALKKGLDPEALTGKHPPKIRMYSKYERRTDTRTYDDR